jgi:hypothetical protein
VNVLARATPRSARRACERRTRRRPVSAKVTPLRPVSQDASQGAAREKFIAGDYARELAAAEPYAAGGSQIYVFLDGHYKPGERHLHARSHDCSAEVSRQVAGCRPPVARSTPRPTPNPECAGFWA